MQLLDNDTVAAWIFLTPALILLGLFIIWPIIYLFYLSFTAGSFTSTGTYLVGFKNYWRLLLNSDFWQVIFNTVYFTLGSLFPSLVIPLGLAVLLNRSIALRGILRSAYFLPSIVSLVAAGLGFRWLFQNTGPVNGLLNFFAIQPISWLGDTFWAMPVIILFSIWKQLGFNMVVFLAGLQTIPYSRYEAAELDGANDWQQFWHITLPGLQPTLIFATVTTAIFTLRSFEPVYVITGGGPLNSTNLLVYYIYQEAFGQFDFGYAAAVATVLLAVTLLLVYLQLRTWEED
ncbi:carbohydrate ABC transporter membrane protein 1, CUT1 family [Anabaena cylindrica PCC 7122]|uniref:Carbohydrate ABC transporter membrane protein 1, CUT1 family n=2 Tax=Nostocaceae TaxID=1162 RepID=K9ZM53_ANACC|nr:carbohydrate ABC transporter membrane protein 1, CUT1 family [Anabaena cylindrica PCC 7122]BAY03082.1 sugar ABC transporter permease [Anabaena cylindrica PCC 7122]